MTPEQKHHETTDEYAARQTAEQTAARAEFRARMDVQAILETEHGRRFLWRLLECAGLYRLSFTRAGNEPALEISKNEGRRSLGLEVRSWIQDASPEAYIRMQQEHLLELQRGEDKGDGA